MHYYVGIAASSEPPTSRLIEISREFIDALGRYNDVIRLVLGGYWGLMKYIAEYAHDRGFTIIFILPEEPREGPPRRGRFVIIRTEMGYRSRSTILTYTSDVLVCMGGRVGSMIEVLLAYSYGKPVIVIKGTGMDTDKLEHGFREYIDSRMLSKIYYTANGVDAARILLNLLNLS